jgi:hypothetical protein
MAAPLAELALRRNPDDGLDTVRTKEEHCDPTGRLHMFALLSSLVFAGAAYVAAYAVASTFHESRSRIVDAFHGRPLERIRPLLSAAA